MNTMKMSTLSSSQLHLLKCTTNTLANSISSSSSSSISTSSVRFLRPTILSSSSSSSSLPRRKCTIVAAANKSTKPLEVSTSRLMIVGAVSVGVAMLLMGIDDQQQAMALGPEGPLMEEFWDNVRRYALYALTVSTGALYTVFLPIYELLKNPISAVLVLIILGGGFFIMTQVVSAMIGNTDFNYQYYY